MTTNTYRANCDRCGDVVEPGEGLVKGGKGFDGSGGAWAVVHNSCIPVFIPEDVIKGPPDDYWQKAIIRRVRKVVTQLEALDPEDLARLQQTPQFALLREWIGQRDTTDYDL